MLKLKTLKEIQGNINKIEFIKNNKDDEGFLLDDMITTKISVKKLSKVVPVIKNNPIGDNIFHFLDFLTNRCSGKDTDLSIINAFIYKNGFSRDEKFILEGLVCKSYAVGVGVSMFNEAIPKNPILESGYMGCIPFNEKKARDLIDKEKVVMSQVKNDGQFLNAIVSNKGIQMTSRAGLTQYINGDLVLELLKIRERVYQEFVMTGELLVDGYDRQTANGMIRGLIASNKKIEDADLKESSKFLKKYGLSIEEVESKLRYIVWDCLPLEGFKQHYLNQPYIERLSTLETMIANSKSEMIKVTEYKIITSYSEAIEHFKYLLDRGEEGSVLKSIQAPWINGKHAHQIKMKLEMELELRVKGFNKGKDKTDLENTLGSLYLESEDGLLRTKASGIKLEVRNEIWSNTEAWRDEVVTIKCNGTSRNNKGEYSLLNANLIEHRTDKLRANTLEEIIEIEHGIIESKKLISALEE
jgi:hypothetical protein